mmetsp:Transcript_23521/g.66963  ORF Transcript_23521/g.66963 Transcript_23521/m.66963 type:complete len:169 (+) Transcript_23521:44-550(+)
MVMDWINQGASALNSGIDAVVHYISQNGVAIGFILVIAYFVRSSVTKNSSFIEAAGGGHVLAQGTSAARNATSREEELRQVRLRQQELADERAKEAAKLRQEKEAKERERKNNAARKNTNLKGDKLGGNKTTTTTTTTVDTPGYNPMQPWATHSSGYRPARRTVNGGG